MRNFSKLGATALAMALSLTLVAPITANAQVIWTREKTATEDYYEGATLNRYKYTYTNEDTKETVTLEDQYGTNDGVLAALASELKTLTIATDSYNETLTIRTTKDVSKFTNFKSNKKNLKVKVLSSREHTDPSEEKYITSPDFNDKDGNYYYRDVNGKLVKVEKAKIDTDMPKGTDAAIYTIRLYAKKAGNYKFSYDAVKKDGTTVKKTIKVIAKEFGSPIKAITFAGKNIYVPSDGKEDQLEMWTKGFGENVTTAKSGKLRVTMNENFKLKKIEVGTPNIETKAEKGYTKTSYKESMSSLDQYCTWKKVKNGKKIKLSKVDTSAMGEGINEYGEYSSKEYDTKTTKASYKGTSTVTYIRITYYDKKNKTTERGVLAIQKVQK